VGIREFIARFRSKTLDDPTAFREFVIQTLALRFDGLQVDRAADPLVVVVSATNCGLQNLHAIQRRDNTTKSEMRELVIKHFERMFAKSDHHGHGPAPIHWADAKARLRPQFMPAEYAHQTPAPLAHVPVNADVSIALVVDLENTYSYVRTADLSLWGVSYDAAFEQAVANLDSASTEMAAHISDGPNSFVAVELKDGYDAARILLPQFRAFLVERLGEPFLAGIPNRDFLICWSQQSSAEFQAFVKAKIASDCAVQPYPLTSAVLLVTESSLSPESAG
jgi:hypothetical protein